MCPIQSAKDNKILFDENRSGNVYTMNFHDLSKQNVKYFQPLKRIVSYGIKRLGHANMKLAISFLTMTL